MQVPSLAPGALPTPPPPAGGWKRLLYHPYVALAVCGLITTGTLQLSWRPWMQLPVIGSHAALSRLAYGLMVIATIVVSRHTSRRATVLVNIALGELTLFALAGPRAWAVFLATQALVYFVINRIRWRLVYIIVASLAIAGGGYMMAALGGVRPIVGDLGNLRFGVLFQIGIQLSRILFFCWEVEGMPREARKFINLLSYCNGLLFWAGPQSNAYRYTVSRKPREELDRLGATQLYRGVCKMAIVTLVGVGLMKLFPTFDRFFFLNVPSRLLFVQLVAVVYFLRLSGPYDIGTGLANLGGFYCEDTYHYPLLATRPMDFWRNYNRPMVDYQLRMFGYPVARLFKNAAVRIVLLLLALNVFRTVWHSAVFSVPAGLGAFKPLRHFESPVNLLLMMLLGDAFLLRPLLESRMRRVFVVLGFIITQGFYTYVNIFDMAGRATYDYRAPREQVACFQDQLFRAQISCPAGAAPKGTTAPTAAGTKGASP